MTPGEGKQVPASGRGGVSGWTDRKPGLHPFFDTRSRERPERSLQRCRVSGICRLAGAVRPPAGQQGQIPDPERGDGVEGEALAQAVGMAGAAVPGAGSDFQRVKRIARSARAALSGRSPGRAVRRHRQQHPVQGLPALSVRPPGRSFLQRGDRGHAERRLALPVLRRQQVHLGAAQREARRPPLPPVRALSIYHALPIITVQVLLQPFKRHIGYGAPDPSACCDW